MRIQPTNRVKKLQHTLCSLRDLWGSVMRLRIWQPVGDGEIEGCWS